MTISTSMAAQNFLIMNLLRIITPEEIGEIATKHNGGKFLSLTDLVTERVEQNIYRDFSSSDSTNEIHEAHSAHAKILPFNKIKNEEVSETKKIVQEESLANFDNNEVEKKDIEKDNKIEKVEHSENENMSSFILIEKARLKKTQQVLKQKEIIDLYQKNSNVDVEQIKGANSNFEQSREAGVLVNKKQY